MRNRTLTLLTLLLPVSLAAQNNPPYSGARNWKQLCRKAQAAPLKAPVFHGPLSQKQLARCDEMSLYYGFGGKPDYRAAAQCGWYQRAHPRPNIGDMFYGPGVLSMLYANGLGVPRNDILAIRFACENPWAAPAAMEYRIGHLEYMQKHGPLATKFDLCDDATSGLNAGACAEVQARFRDARRRVKIDQIRAALPAAGQRLFPALQNAENAFVEARIQNEVDLSGTLRAALEFQEQETLLDQFVLNLHRFGRGAIPHASASNLAFLDRQLNLVYQKLQRIPDNVWQEEVGTIRPSGIQLTERKWLKLVDVWQAFGRVAYPRLSGTRIRAELIRLRLHQLRELVPTS